MNDKRVDSFVEEDFAARFGPPPEGRVFRARRRIRLGDTTASGRLRLDAAARYLQDIASDDVEDAGTEEPSHLWLVRSTLLAVMTPFERDRFANLATWASGVGPRWAARRTNIAGDAGGRIEAESVWVYLESATLRPARLKPHFHGIFDTGTERAISARLSLHAEPPPDGERISWPLRVTDYDIMAHVNNAAYWEPIEAVMARDEAAQDSNRFLLEYRQAIEPRAEITLAIGHSCTATQLWFLSDNETAAVARLWSAGDAARADLRRRSLPEHSQ